MSAGHDPYLVALSVVIAILGGYTGFGLAARIRGTPGVSRRLLLAGAAAFLAVGIWTMHFVGMLAAPLPPDTVYLVLPTIISFLICALVVGISLFFVSIGEPSLRRVISSAVLLGAGIASMHYVGIHGLAGNFAVEHDTPMILLSILIAIITAYGGLRAFLARQDGIRLIASSIGKLAPSLRRPTVSSVPRYGCSSGRPALGISGSRSPALRPTTSALL